MPTTRTRSVALAALATGLVVGGVAVADGLDHPTSATPTSSTPNGFGTRDGAPAVASLRGSVGEADGVLPDGVTVIDGGYAGVANLDPALLAALRGAAGEAADDGVELDVNSGWRSPAYQEQLLDQAIAEYGSREAAARWVATPATSPHVTGDAVDIGPSDAAAWLSDHGAAYGLCRVYGNEPWHFELRAGAEDGGCPPTYDDPTDDPRMNR
jgi:zinc D-Ala-D-Ala carboxypeptidase